MIELYKDGAEWRQGRPRPVGPGEAQGVAAREGRRGTIARRIIDSHRIDGSASDGKLRLKFDCLASHDITYVGIIQTARASGLKAFPVPYVLTNCHNSLCAVGGTINEDDHRFGLSCAVKYGGVFVPPHVAVIHQYMREMYAGCGKMIIGSDSHTRYGALGTLAVGEGGPELVKQLLGRPYEISDPEVVCVYLTGRPRPGVGPQDVALALIAATFKNGFVKNKVMEFTGPGAEALSVEFRIGIDVMTTETTCWSSVWQTDEKVRAYLENHLRGADYKELKPEEGAFYDSLICVDLGEIEPMIALPFHPSNAYTIREFISNAPDILRETELRAKEQFGSIVRDGVLTEKFYGGNMHVDQGVIAGCSGGTFENICRAATIIGAGNIGADAYSLSVYPASEPIYLELMRNGALSGLTLSGATVRSCFCGPCFGAGDVPANNAFSIRHTTRNFPNREGSKPGEGQLSWVALMDAASIAATSLRGGVLTPADELEGIDAVYNDDAPACYRFDPKVYVNRVYNGWQHARPEEKLVFGPNIADWPRMEALADNMLLEVASVITDPVTTTDELIPSGETSSFRSNPERLAGFALSRKDPQYVQRARAVRELERERLRVIAAEADGAGAGMSEVLKQKYAAISDTGASIRDTQLGSVVCARKPGDGSAREQAASCQKVLGGFANISEGYATKRYRSNLINWGMIPFVTDSLDKAGLTPGDLIFIPRVRKAIAEAGSGGAVLEAQLMRVDGTCETLRLSTGELSDSERAILLSGCLINYYNTEEGDN
ncbi:MAG: hydratase [Clostridia bacterium]|nr:hydratase [Clostridia bacterium]